MLRLKVRPERNKAAVRNLVLAIMCGANLLPIKGLIYALSHAKANRYISASQKQDVQIGVRRMSKDIKELTILASDLQKLREVSGTTLHRSIKGATTNYVKVFYSLNHDERKSYLKSSAGKHKKIKNTRNLLLIPAIMSDSGEPEEDVSHYLINAIYKIPYRALYHSSKAAIHTELFKQATGMRSAPDDAMQEFSETLSKMDGMMQEIERGGIAPEQDEAFKQEFVTDAVLLSQSADTNIAEIMSAMIMPSAFTEGMARRIVRRQIGR